MVSDSTGGVASGVEMFTAEGGMGSGLVLLWASPLNLCLGFERAIAVSFITVERCWVVFGVKYYNKVNRSDKLRDHARLKPFQQSDLVLELRIHCTKNVSCSRTCSEYNIFKK